MKQTCIICDKCRSHLYGVGYSTTWSKARRNGWTHPNDDHRRHLCPRCSEAFLLNAEKQIKEIEEKEESDAE